MGIVERDDTIKVIEEMVDTLEYIDKSRVGVWGWSYGGYLTAQILAKEQNYVKCGVAIAPVSQWELYGKFIQRGLNRWSKFSEQKLRFFSTVKIERNAFNNE